MKQLKHKKIGCILAIIVTILLLFILVYVINTNVYVQRRIELFFSIKASNRRVSKTIDHSKDIGAFLWEYEIPEKEIFYQDSIRTMHFKMTSAFAEKAWALNKNEANCVKVLDESGFGSRIIVPCEYYGLQEKSDNPRRQWKVDLRNSYGCFDRNGLYFTIQSGLPKDMPTAYILATIRDEDFSEFPGYAVTFVIFFCYM